jgi:hypothetical protein
MSSKIRSSLIATLAVAGALSWLGFTSVHAADLPKANATAETQAATLELSAHSYGYAEHYGYRGPYGYRYGWYRPYRHYGCYRPFRYYGYYRPWRYLYYGYGFAPRYRC